MDGLSFSFKIGSKNDYDNPNFDAEYNVLCEWVDILEKRYNKKFTIVANSSDYTTLQPEGCLDLLRLKYGNVKWIKLFVSKNKSKQLQDDPRFADEKKKTSLYWKSTLNDTDISKYFDVIDDSVEFLTK